MLFDGFIANFIFSFIVAYLEILKIRFSFISIDRRCISQDFLHEILHILFSKIFTGLFINYVI